ncbi:MAG TPA: hypothetical protein VNZ52_01455 [Candidatus Thermoplasmatota archaeon]|nr:hypothetical protein [Candidatus Thermoplasmatota archaeon]
MRWRAAVAYDADSTARLLEEALKALGYRWSRDVGARAADSTLLLLSMPRTVATHRFRVTAPADFVVEVYDTEPSPGALLPELEVLGVLPGSEPQVRALLAEVGKRAPRAPWRFSFRQRLAVGLLHPAFGDARRAWRAVMRDE